jgi:hypothetical protein
MATNDDGVGMATNARDSPWEWTHPPEPIDPQGSEIWFAQGVPMTLGL